MAVIGVLGDLALVAIGISQLADGYLKDSMANKPFIGWFRATFALLLALITLPCFLMAYCTNKYRKCCVCCYSFTTVFSLFVAGALLYMQLVVLPEMKTQNLTQLCESPPYGPTGAYAESPDAFYMQFVNKVMCSDVCPCELDYFQKLQTISDKKLRE